MVHTGIPITRPSIHCVGCYCHAHVGIQTLIKIILTLFCLARMPISKNEKQGKSRWFRSQSYEVSPKICLVFKYVHKHTLADKVEKFLTLGKNGLCLWVSHDKQYCKLQLYCSLSWFCQRQNLPWYFSSQDNMILALQNIW